MKARDTRLDRTVAIKISGQQFRERFEREARAAARIFGVKTAVLKDATGWYTQPLLESSKRK